VITVADLDRARLGFYQLADTNRFTNVHVELGDKPLCVPRPFSARFIFLTYCAEVAEKNVTCATCKCKLHEIHNRKTREQICRERGNKPRPIPELTESEKERFWRKVEVRTLDECWPWTGGQTNGCGMFYVRSDQFRAPRVAAHLKLGSSTLLVCHTCDNELCCNYERHLFYGTHKDNSQDSWNKGRNVWQKTGRKRGEESGTSKLTAHQVHAIRASNLPRKELAAQFNISPRTIHDIRTFDTWRHLV